MPVQSSLKRSSSKDASESQTGGVAKRARTVWRCVCSVQWCTCILPASKVTGEDNHYRIRKTRRSCWNQNQLDAWWAELIQALGYRPNDDMFKTLMGQSNIFICPQHLKSGGCSRGRVVPDDFHAQWVQTRQGLWRIEPNADPVFTRLKQTGALTEGPSRIIDNAMRASRTARTTMAPEDSDTEPMQGLEPELALPEDPLEALRAKINGLSISSSDQHELLLLLDKADHDRAVTREGIRVTASSLLAAGDKACLRWLGMSAGAFGFLLDYSTDLGMARCWQEHIPLDDEIFHQYTGHHLVEDDNSTPADDGTDGGSEDTPDDAEDGAEDGLENVDWDIWDYGEYSKSDFLPEDGDECLLPRKQSARDASMTNSIYFSAEEARQMQLFVYQLLNHAGQRTLEWREIMLFALIKWRTSLTNSQAIDHIGLQVALPTLSRAYIKFSVFLATMIQETWGRPWDRDEGSY